MAAQVWLVEAILLGCLLVHRFAGFSVVGPAWTRRSLIFGAGTAAGIALSSFVFFLFSILLGIRKADIGLEGALLGWAGYEVFRHRARALHAGEKTRPPLVVSIAAISLLLALGIAAVSMAGAWDANPQGDWDAWAIWNLRARFLASSGGLAHRAWSPIIGASTHAEYPLLLSSFVARCWVFGGSLTPAVPAATSYAFFLALIALMGGGVATLRGLALGLLAALTLASTPALLHQAPNQYADIPLACYMAGALVFALLDRPVLAGILGGCAAWTKDEGLLFVLVLLAVSAVWKRWALPAILAGAGPGVILAVVFKTWLAKGNSSMLSTSLPGALQRLTDASRYGTTMAAFAREFAHLGIGWYHPILPLIALALALRFDRARRRDAAYCGALSALVLLGYFGVYILTNNDLKWQLQTSLNRLLVQVWPAIILAGFAALRAPEVAANMATVRPKAPRKMRTKA